MRVGKIETWESVDDVFGNTDRLGVPGGWLYKYSGAGTCGLVFVPSQANELTGKVDTLEEKLSAAHSVLKRVLNIYPDDPALGNRIIELHAVIQGYLDRWGGF